MTAQGRGFRNALVAVAGLVTALAMIGCSSSQRTTTERITERGVDGDSRIRGGDQRV